MSATPDPAARYRSMGFYTLVLAMFGRAAAMAFWLWQVWSMQKRMNKIADLPFDFAGHPKKTRFVVRFIEALANMSIARGQLEAAIAEVKRRNAAIRSALNVVEGDKP